MKKKYLVMTILFLSIGMACMCKASIYTDGADPQDHHWFDSDNWDNGIPGAAVDADMSVENTLCQIWPSDYLYGGVKCQGVFVGMGATNELDMLGSTMNCSYLSVGRDIGDANTNGYFYMTGGVVTTGELQIPYATGINPNYMPIGEAQIFGGTVHVTSQSFLMGSRTYFRYVGGYGTLQMKNGGLR